MVWVGYTDVMADDTRQVGRVDGGLLDRVDVMAHGLGLSRRDLIERWVRIGLEGRPPVVERVTVPRGFDPSVLPGHADAPGLGWYRPSSVEANRGVEVDPRQLRAAKEKL